MQHPPPNPVPKNMWTRLGIGLFTLCTLAAAAPAVEVVGELPTRELDRRVGQPVDLAPWAYTWRGDRPIQPKPEAYFIPRRLERIDKVYRTARAALPPDQLKSIYYDMPDLFKPFPPAPTHKLAAGLLWTGGLSKYQVELHWADNSTAPPPDAVDVRVYPTAFGWFGWTVDQVLTKPEVSPDGRTWTYLPPAGAKMDTAYSQHVDAAAEMVAVFCDAPAVPDVTITGPGPGLGQWKRLDIEIEGDIADGRLETSTALAGPATPLPGARHGFALPLLYAPAARPGLDSRITFWTGPDDGFTIQLRDLDDGPIYIPARGVFVARTGTGQTKQQFLQNLATQHLKSTRQAVRDHAEAGSWDDVMQDVRLWTCPPGTTAPPLPQVPDPPMQVRLSDQRWTDAWRAASDQLTGRHMWGGLAFEVGRVAREMELVGLHAQADPIYDHFLAAPGAKSDGDYADGAGALELATSLRHDMGYSHDGTHASTGRLLFAMAERYFLTGDRDWFARRRPRLQAAADWIVRQRRSYMKDVPNRGDLFVAGLMPPQMLGDYALPSCDWHWYYCDNAFALQGLSRLADALTEFDPEVAKAYRAEADAFRVDLRRAASREVALSPVRRGRDGLYHAYLPLMAYARGLTGPELGAPQFPDCDMFMGSLPLAEPFAAVDATDPRMVDTLDLMEEMGTSTFAPQREAERKQKGLPADDAWFWTPYSRLPKASHNANVYLLQDDVPNFLRFWMTEYASMVGANGKFWEAWAFGNFRDCDNPDNGTAGWFLENFRNLLVMEDRDETLWLARATPRAWLQQGKTIAVKNAPTYFGPAGYEITSDTDHGRITATIEVPSRRPPHAILLRLRHPTGAPMKGVTVDGKPWTAFDAAKETITLPGVTGTVTVTATY